MSLDCEPRPVELAPRPDGQQVVGESAQRGFLDAAKSVGRVALGMMASAAVAFEVFHATNETTRFGATALVQEGLDNSKLSTLAFAATTFAIEAASALSTVYLTRTATGSKVMDWLNLRWKGRERGLKEGFTAAEGALALGIGSAAATAYKHSKNPDRTAAQDVKYGLGVATGLSIVTSPLGYLYAEGVSRVGVERASLGLLLTAGALAVGSAIVNRIRGRNKPQHHSPEEGFAEPKYHLSEEEFTALQGDLVKEVKTQQGESVCAVVMNPRSRYADLVRTLEAGLWPELEELMEPYEDASQFIALVDTRNSTDRIVHAFRLSNAASRNEEPDRHREKMDVALLQDMIDSRQVTKEELETYYSERGVSLPKSMSVESNFIVGERIKGLQSGMLGYAAIFALAAERLGEGLDREGLKGAVFAHLNQPAKISLSRVGLKFEHLAGRELDTPTTGNKTDPSFRPYAILASGDNLDILRGLANMAPPILRV